jgi:hypothetical protein
VVTIFVALVPLPSPQEHSPRASKDRRQHGHTVLGESIG